MDKFISYEKLSKKEKRKIDASQWKAWGELNPVTRKPQHSKAYTNPGIGCVWTRSQFRDYYFKHLFSILYKNEKPITPKLVFHPAYG